MRPHTFEANDDESPRVTHCGTDVRHMSPFVFCSIFLPFWSFIQLGLVAGHPEKRSHWKHRGEDPRSAGKGLEAAQKG